MIIKGLADEPLPVYGDGQNVRDWLYVEDHAKALTLVRRARPRRRDLQYRRPQRAHQSARRSSRSAICSIAWSPRRLGSRHRLISFVTDRPGHDRRYAIDASKLERELAGARRRPSKPDLPRPSDGIWKTGRGGRPSLIGATKPNASGFPNCKFKIGRLSQPGAPWNGCRAFTLESYLTLRFSPGKLTSLLWGDVSTVSVERVAALR